MLHICKGQQTVAFEHVVYGQRGMTTFPPTYQIRCLLESNSADVLADAIVQCATQQ